MNSLGKLMEIVNMPNIAVTTILFQLYLHFTPKFLASEFIFSILKFLFKDLLIYLEERENAFTSRCGTFCPRLLRGQKAEKISRRLSNEHGACHWADLMILRS